MLTSYADDVTVYTTGPKVDSLVSSLNDYLPELCDFFTRHNLEISAAKSTVSLITPHTKEANLHPQVNINGQTLPLEKYPKILGVTFDPMLTFGAHCKNVATRVKQRNATLRALAGVSWGQDKETLAMTYKATGRSILNYATPVWSEITSDSNLAKLQVAQNSALRTITGCHKMAASDHLHQECAMLPVKDHSHLLSAQYLASCTEPAHPNHWITQAAAPPRRMKKTLQMAAGPTVQRASAALGPNANAKALRAWIHTDIVTNAMENFKPNVVLGGRPPPIHSSERGLPRKVRSSLSQLRSGFSTLLNSYNNRINPAVADSCPNCNSTPHDTRHLFSCTAKPTQANKEDLWLRPVFTATELGLHH
jgi:hypothetical protein